MNTIVRLSVLACLFAPLLAQADTLGQNTSVQSGSYAGSASYSGGNNVTFAGGGSQAYLPQFGINTGVTGPALFTEATRNAGLLYEAYLNALRNCGQDEGYTTLGLAKRKLAGVDVKYDNAEARFSPTNYFLWQSLSITGKKRLDTNLVIKAPRFGTEVYLKKGKYLGLIYVSSIQDQNVTQQDLMAAVEMLTLEEIQPYFVGRRLHLVFVPGGSGINIGVSTEGTSKGLFGSIGNLMGSTSGGIGASYSNNDGTTHMAATLGNQVLVFLEGEGIPIKITTAPPVSQEPQRGENTNVGNEVQEIVVRIKVETVNRGAQYQEDIRQKEVGGRVKRLSPIVVGR